MPIVTPVPIPAGPPVPNSGDPEVTFDAQYEDFNAWERNQAAPGMNALADATHQNALSSQGSATAAQTGASDAQAAAAAASSSANATKWVSGAAYADGQVVWSPINYMTYRRLGAGSGTTDPSADLANWLWINRYAARNIVINGAMNIDQRNAGTVMALSTTAQYFVDRWASLLSSAGTVYTGRATWLGVGAASANYDGTTKVLCFQRPSGSSYTGVAKAIQPLETIDSLHLAGKTVTLSFRLFGNAGWLGGAVTAAVVTSTGTDQTAAQFFAGSAAGQATAGSATFTPTTTPTRRSLTVTIPANATQVAVLFQNAGWTGSGASTDIVAISGVQLEVGGVATEFEHRPFVHELTLCQRYYAKSYPADVVPGAVTYDGSAVALSQNNSTYGHTFSASVSYPVEMRSAATFSTFNPYNGDSGKIMQAGGGGSFPASGTTTTISNGKRGVVFSANVTTAAAGSTPDTFRFQWTANAEL